MGGLERSAGIGGGRCSRWAVRGRPAAVRAGKGAGTGAGGGGGGQRRDRIAGADGATPTPAVRASAPRGRGPQVSAVARVAAPCASGVIETSTDPCRR